MSYQTATDNITESAVTSPVTKRGNALARRSLKKSLSQEQVEALEKHFATDPMPKPKIKLELAAKLGIKPEILNWWFQSTRNKLKKLEAQRMQMMKLHAQQRMRRPPLSGMRQHGRDPIAAVSTQRPILVQTAAKHVDKQ